VAAQARRWMKRCGIRPFRGWAAAAILGSAGARALAHGFDGGDEDPLNPFLIALSFALIGAFVYLATRKSGPAAGDDR